MNGLTKRPQHAAALGRVVATAGKLEADLAFLLASMTHLNAKLATAMFLSINNMPSQRAMVLAAAREVMTPRALEYFEAFMDDWNSRYKERNKLVHGVWASSDSHPDKALLLRSDAITAKYAHMNSSTAGDASFDIWLDALAYTVKDIDDVDSRLKAYQRRLARLIMNVAFDIPLPDTSAE
jgi:hypothetical protein